MQHRHRSSPGSRARAFTLVELLIVIGIIALLVGILLPVANKVRVAARRAETLGTINRISQGCEQYFTVFGSYPGLFGNADVIPVPTSPTINITFSNYPSGSTPTTPLNPTSTENMCLSLLGGLSILPTTPPSLGFDLNTVGQGASSMNSAKPGRSQPFMEVKPTELTTSLSNPRNASMVSVGQWTANDTALPEILDSFGTGQPILYMRASRGNSSFVNNQPTPTGPPTNSNAQYDIRQLAPYGFPQTDNAMPDPNSSKMFSDYYPPNGLLAAGVAAYFGNSELTTDATNPVPQHKDQYILISAGPDGIFGTADDIRN